MPTKPEQIRATAGEPILEVKNLSVHYDLQGSALSRLFGVRGRSVRAIDGVTVDIRAGEVLGVVGESGSGKTTLGRALLGLAPATAGSISYHSQTAGERTVSAMRGKELRKLRTDLQMVFQDPSAALNPSMTIADAVGHPLQIHNIARGEDLRNRVVSALERVGLTPAENYLSKYPADLSGGQKQRVVIARAIILDPDVLVADEPVSMLDMSVRAKILQLLLDLKNELGLTYVYITHDLASAKFFCDRIAIMYLGRIVEIGPTAEIFANPRHPYTKALLAAIPDPDPERLVERHLPRGEIPDAADPPQGCSFHPRCPEAVAQCGWEARDLRTLVEDHWTRSDTEEYDRERRVVGDLAHLDDRDAAARIGTTGSAPAREILDAIRAEDPREPFWTGVQAIEDHGSGVELTLHPATDPALRSVGGAQVACVLYPEEGATSEDGSGGGVPPNSGQID